MRLNFVLKFNYSLNALRAEKGLDSSVEQGLMSGFTSISLVRRVKKDGENLKP